VAVVQFSAGVGVVDSSPMGGGFIIKLNPPCTLQNCRGMLLLLSLIDMIGSLWPWMTLDDGRDGWTGQMMNEKNFIS
jgi:hypothetical protein